MRISQIWESIPTQLAKENKKFIFSAIAKSARAREYEGAIQWLKKAGMIHQVFYISTPKMPLDAYSDRNIFKVYTLDVGLLGAMSHITPKIILEQNQIFKEFKGAFAENFVLQELIAAGKHTPYYWTSNARAEVNYVLQHDMDIYPLEVKAGESKHKKSLRSYQERFQPPILSRATTMNWKYDGDVINYPLYLVSRFPVELS